LCALSYTEVEVEVVAVQAGEFAPAAAGPGGGDDQQSGGLAAERGGLVGDADDFRWGGPDLFGFDVVAAASAAASFVDGVVGDEVFVGGVGEDHREQLGDAGDGGGGVAALVEVDDPRADGECGDVVKWRVAPAGVDVAVQDAAVVVQGAWVEVEGGEPGVYPFGDGRPATCGVDPGSAALVGLDVVGVVVGGVLGGESGDGGDVPVSGGVADAPGARADLLCPGHVDLRCEAMGDMSGVTVEGRLRKGCSA
jgi:hypothetical protein